MTPYAIGIDIGGTRLKCGAVNESGKVLAHDVAPSEASSGIRQLLPAIKRTVAGFRKKFGEPCGVGLALTGVVDPEVGVVYLPGKFKGLEGFEIVPKLRQALKLPVLADNDGQLAMLAERRFGDARKLDWAVTLTLGTGVGSGVLLDGRVLRDPSFLFGTQIGHSVLQNYGGKTCLTTARGTGETLCSCTALALSVRDGLQRGIPSTLTERYWKDAHAIDFHSVIDAVRAGDELCVEEFDRWVGNLECLLVTAAHAYTPRKIILGGGGVHAADLFLPRLQRFVHRHTFRYPARRRLPVVVSSLTDRVGLLGAASLFLENA
ncbi:MAG: ROK family protein [Planctomycetota bacterium]